ncbi:hypothetical protein CHELA1G11_12443 [Hyphomicrobiales bacterium]|nr:hypothetical protein CHELA1G2_11863 [Hyphomicrobiales bacterium]CAH1664872.1 hypothetical protein CHELA1G11_12443 [Hyphomicrobiales bacterium]
MPSPTSSVVLRIELIGSQAIIGGVAPADAAADGSLTILKEDDPGRLQGGTDGAQVILDGNALADLEVP